jgi:LDH2 family malate/lactate/ureidoglycolate dehydrogenase
MDWRRDVEGEATTCAHELVPAAMRECLEHEGAALFTTELLSSVASGLDELAALGDDFAVFFEPPSFDQRIVNQ